MGRKRDFWHQDALREQTFSWTDSQTFIVHGQWSTPFSHGRRDGRFIPWNRYYTGQRTDLLLGQQISPSGSTILLCINLRVSIEVSNEASFRAIYPGRSRASAFFLWPVNEASSRIQLWTGWPKPRTTNGLPDLRAPASLWLLAVEQVQCSLSSLPRLCAAGVM